MRSTKFNRAKQRLLMKKYSTADFSCTTWLWRHRPWWSFETL